MPRSRVLPAACVYFAVVFGLGFLLGCVRVPLLEPRLGARAAELLELPLMVAGSAWLARWRVRRTSDLSPAQQLVVGAFALAFLLGAEVGLGMLRTGRDPVAVLFDRDPVAGPCYFAALGAFALWPWWFARRGRSVAPSGAPSGSSRTTHG